MKKTIYAIAFLMVLSGVVFISMACKGAGSEAEADAHCVKVYEDENCVAYKTWVEGTRSSLQVRLVEKRR
jgi:hypothetical protein